MVREKSVPFQMRVSPEWLAQIDDWRRKQTAIPSRAEAIRHLVDRGINKQ